MSVLSANRAPEEAPVLLRQAPLLPRVNLLPPEIEERRRFRQVQAGLAGAAFAAVGLVALLTVSASGAVADAQGELDVAAANGGRLTQEAATYRDVTQVYAQAAAAQTMLTQAMGREVRWSRLLNDLSLTVPDNVWLKSVAFTQTDATAAGTGIGTASFAGVGFSHEDVAVWLESLAGQTGYRDPYFSGSVESLMGPRKIVSFTSTTTLTEAALSGRYTVPAGG